MGKQWFSPSADLKLTLNGSRHNETLCSGVTQHLHLYILLVLSQPSLVCFPSKHLSMSEHLIVGYTQMSSPTFHQFRGARLAGGPSLWEQLSLISCSEFHRRHWQNQHGNRSISGQTQPPWVSNFSPEEEDTVTYSNRIVLRNKGDSGERIWRIY